MVSVSCFGVRVLVMLYFMLVHYTFSSVWVAEWPPFRKQLPALLAICCLCILYICNIFLFPVGICLLIASVPVHCFFYYYRLFPYLVWFTFGSVIVVCIIFA